MQGKDRAVHNIRSFLDDLCPGGLQERPYYAQPFGEGWLQRLREDRPWGKATGSCREVPGAARDHHGTAAGTTSCARCRNAAHSTADSPD